MRFQDAVIYLQIVMIWGSLLPLWHHSVGTILPPCDHFRSTLDALFVSLACALFRQETVVRAAVEALFEIIAEKSELGSKSL